MNRAFLFLVGAAAGSAAATLMAPCSGQRTRKLARRKIEDSAERLSKMGDTLRQTHKDLMHHGEKLVRSANKVFA